MKQDIELMRKFLFIVEDEYKPGDVTLSEPQIEGHDTLTIAEHCDLLCQQVLIKNYNPMIG